jgi:16S rRNA (cytidine1402-2'-O)-methyltransferase
VAAVRDAGFPVVPVPGASAVTAALSASGLQADRYLFLGFVPRKGAERTRLLTRASTEEWTVVLFEAPGRLAALLDHLAALAGPARRVVVARELTKLHEELKAGPLAEVADYYSKNEPQGEVTVLLAGTGEPALPPDRSEEGRALARQLLERGATRREAARQIAADLGLARNEAYRLVMEL